MNPFGAGAAACFGAANIFRLCFRESLPYGEPDGAFSLSLLDYDPNASAPANPDLDSVDLGENVLVGLGAIGNGAIWALAGVPQLRGVLDLVDHETVELTNLERYILTTQAHASAETSKVALASATLRGSGLDVRPHRARWGRFLATRGDWHFSRVAVAVDNASTRQAVQAALPQWVVNAWTQTGNLGVSRHAFLDDRACLMCLYLPEAKGADEDQIIAEAIGLPEARMEVRHLLYTNAPVGRAMLERISAARGIPAESLLGFEERPLRAFYSEAICGGIVLRLGGDWGGHAEVPMAFQSTLAGIMLAAELVAHAGSLRQATPQVITTIDLLRPLGVRLSEPRKKSPSGRCICQDQDYIHRYIAKYGLNGTDEREVAVAHG